MQIVSKPKGMVMLKGVTANWTNLRKPAEWNDSPTDYRVEVVFDSQQMKDFIAAITPPFLENRKWLAENGRNITAGGKKKLLDVDPNTFFNDKEVEDRETGEGTGTYKLKFKRSIREDDRADPAAIEAVRPLVISADKSPFLTEPGKGAELNVLFRPQGYVAGKTAGIKLALDSVQVVRSGGATSADMFDDESDGEPVGAVADGDSLPDEDNFD